MNDTGKGWCKHNSFGLRKEWLQLYLNYPSEWEDKELLGNRQVQSLKMWLKTGGLENSQGKETWFAEIFRAQGMEAILPWELLWVNVVFNFPTAGWFVKNLGLGRWTTNQMQEHLRQYVPRLAPRTVHNAIMELAGLLERTPVGKDLNQGEVLPGRPRSINREGYEYPSMDSIFYALCRLFIKEQKDSLSLEEDILWPWTIFGCEQDYVLQKIILNGEKWFTLGKDYISIKHPVKEWWECGSILTIYM